MIAPPPTHTLGLRQASDLLPHFDIAPGQAVALVRQTPAAEGRELVSLRWGLIPGWADDPVGWSNRSRLFLTYPPPSPVHCFQIEFLRIELATYPLQGFFVPWMVGVAHRFHEVSVGPGTATAFWRARPLTCDANRILRSLFRLCQRAPKTGQQWALENRPH
jgi:hypothetical protein